MIEEYRKAKFRVKVNSNEDRSYLDSEEMALSVTHNGYQWTSIALTEAEAVAVIRELRGFLDAKRGIVSSPAN